MERPVLAFLRDSNETNGFQNHAKAVRIFAEENYGYTTVDFDVSRHTYPRARIRDPFRELSRSGMPVAMVTSLDDYGELSPLFTAEAKRLRDVSGSELPLFAVSRVSRKRKLVDLGPQTYGASIYSPGLYEGLEEASSQATEQQPSDNSDLNVWYANDLNRMQTLTEDERHKLRLKLYAINTGEQNRRTELSFGFAIDEETLQTDWIRGFAMHHRVPTYLNNSLNIAERIRALGTGRRPVQKDLDQRTIFLGFQWNNIDGLEHPIVEFVIEPQYCRTHDEDTVRKIGTHLIAEKQIIPVTDNLQVIDSSYHHGLLTQW